MRRLFKQKLSWIVVAFTEIIASVKEIIYKTVKFLYITTVLLQKINKVGIVIY